MTLKRVYRDPIPAARAIGLLLKHKNKFDEKIVRSFAESLHIFPVGAKVLLSDGNEGVVTYADQHVPALPRIKVTGGSEFTQIPIDLSLKVSRFIDGDLEEDVLTKQQSEWDRYLYALMYGSYEEAVNIYEDLADGKRVEDIYTDIISNGMKEIKALYQENKITLAELYLAASFTREILYTKLNSYTTKQNSKGKIALAVTGNQEDVLHSQIDAAMLKTNGWDVYNFEHPLPDDALYEALTRRNISIIGLSVTDKANLHKLQQTAMFLKHHMPGLFVIVSGSWLPEEAREWGDLFVNDAAEMVRELDRLPHEHFGTSETANE